MTVEKDVLDVAASLVASFGRHATDAYFAHFAPEATFVFYNHPHVLGGRADYQALWGEWEKDGFRILSCHSSNQAVSLISTDCAVFTHHVDTRAHIGGETMSLTERETIVFVLRDGKWLAVHEHLSPRDQEENQ